MALCIVYVMIRVASRHCCVELESRLQCFQAQKRMKAALTCPQCHGMGNVRLYDYVVEAVTLHEKFAGFGPDQPIQ